MDTLITLADTLHFDSQTAKCLNEGAKDNRSSLISHWSPTGNLLIFPAAEVSSRINNNTSLEKLCETVSIDTLHLEVCYKCNVAAPVIAKLEKEVHQHLITLEWHEFRFIKERLTKGLNTLIPIENNLFLKSTVEFIKVQDESNYNSPDSEKSVEPFGGLEMVLHLFSFSHDSPGVEDLNSAGGEECSTSAAQVWMLPHVQLKTLWDCLFYEDDLKWRLVRYVETMLLFSDKNVDHNIITYNRIVLLHGPPGTGKTSLCHALAQRLSIRLSKRYRYCQLVEINSHSLFSRWFSESGKLVMAMFEKIRELYSDPEALIFILIDEVESLAASRNSQGSEPSDAVRVVNAMLTQLDQLKTQANVVVLTTSNLSGRVDLAFVDRADIKEHVGLPSPMAAYAIISSCIYELMHRGIIQPQESLCVLPASKEELESHPPSRLLLSMCGKSESEDPVQSVAGLSGRTMRKLPFLALANNLDAAKCTGQEMVSITLNEFLRVFETTLTNYKKQMDAIEL